MIWMVVTAAVAVGGVTMLGAALGYRWRDGARRLGTGRVMAFAAGMMLAAAVAGLILPSLEGGGRWRLAVTLGGILCGGGFLLALGTLVKRRTPAAEGSAAETHRAAAVFVAAIALHNLPEGLAVGVAFAGDSIHRALALAAGIAAQNLPEGMVLIAPLLRAGVPPRRALVLALSTGLPEMAGVLLGFALVQLSVALLPFVLAFAGGTMLYVLCADMLAESQGEGMAALGGFCLMLAIDVLVG